MPESKRSANAARMFALAQAYLTSGLTQSRFCAAHQLTPSRFYYWLKRFRVQESTGSGALPPLQVSGEGVGSGEVEISYPDGTRIYFSGPVPSGTLKSLLPVFATND